MKNRKLNDALSAALEEMIEATCLDMLPLWLEATQRLRKKYFDKAIPEVPDHLKQGFSDSTRSKYKALAKWRHGVFWQDLLVEEFRDSPKEGSLLHGELRRYAEDMPTLRAIYFSPCENEPPYSYSQKKSAASGIDIGIDSEDAIIRRCVRAAWITIKLIELRWREEEGGPKSDFLKAAVPKTLNDVLKLSDFAKKTGSEKYIWRGVALSEELI